MISKNTIGWLISFLFFSQNGWADSFMYRDQAIRHQFMTHKAANLNRVDPRIKYLPSKKANNCLQYTMGVCTLTEPQNYGRVKYNNANRKQDPSKKLGFQSAEYWSN